MQILMMMGLPIRNHSKKLGISLRPLSPLALSLSLCWGSCSEAAREEEEEEDQEERD